MQRPTRAPSGSKAETGSTFSFDRILQAHPEIKEGTYVSKMIAAAGNLVRSIRTRKGVGQVTLAKKLGMTQPHISELERGLGQNGPTVGTLARIVNELGDELIILSKQEQAIRMAHEIDAAEAAVGELTEKLAEMKLSNLTEVMQALSKANLEDAGNPFKNAIVNGLIMGIHMAIRAFPYSMEVADVEFARKTAKEQLTTKRRFSAIVARSVVGRE